MSALFLSKRLALRIAKVIAIVFFLAWAILTLSLLFSICTDAFVDSISIDDSTEWSKYFLSKSGFSTIRIRSHVASRRHTNDISTIGSNRPKEWFEKMGFEDMHEIEMNVGIPKLFPNDGTIQHVMTMEHPMAPGKYFYYHQKTGVFLCDCRRPACVKKVRETEKGAPITASVSRP